LNAAYERDGSYVDFVHSESTFLAPVLTWRAGNKTTLTLEAEHLDMHGRPDGGLPGSKLSFSLPVHLNIGESTDTIQNRSDRVSYYLTHVFNDNWWITNGFSALLIDSKRFFVSGPESSFLPDQHTIARQIADLPENSQSYFERADAVGKFKTGPSVQHTFLFGLEASKERFGRAISLYPISPLDTVRPIYGQFTLGRPPVPETRHQGADTGGVYIQDQVSIFSRLKLLAGVRFDLSRTLYNDYSPGNLNSGGNPIGTGPGGGTPIGTGPGNGPSVGTGNPGGSSGQGGTQQAAAKCGPPVPDPVTGAYTQCSIEHPHAFSPRAGILYQPVSSVSLYVSYSKSFNPLQLIQYVNFQFVRSFIGRQFEAGAKFDLLRNRLQATAAIYKITHTGFPLIDPSHPFTPTYSGYRRSEGAEFDMVAQLMPGWNVTTSYGFNQGFLRIGFPSDRLLGAPRHSGSTWSVYDIQRGRLKGVSAGLGAYYVGERNGNLFASFNLPAYTRTDAMLAYSKPHWRLQVNLKNLTNIKYYDTDAVQGLVFPGSPLNIEGALRFRF
jgi:outer membrane receptor protein involved in Fe transport